MILIDLVQFDPALHVVRHGWLTLIELRDLEANTLKGSLALCMPSGSPKFRPIKKFYRRSAIGAVSAFGQDGTAISKLRCLLPD